MATSRLAELKGRASAEFAVPQGNDPTGMSNEFLNDVELVKTNIHNIEASTKIISQINNTAMTVATDLNEVSELGELESVVKSTNKMARVAKQLIQNMREETARMKTQPSSASAEIRIRDNLANTLTRKFVDVMKSYQNAQSKYKTDLQKKVRRQIQTVKPDATSEEIDAVFKQGGGAKGVIKKAILKGEAADAIQNEYKKVADKYQDVLTLEASVVELHQMFLDFAILTEKQGELLDKVEIQIKEATEYIDKGNEDLTASIWYQIEIRKCQCIVIVIVMIIVAIIAGVIAWKFA